MNVLCAFGTRPEVIKLAPVIRTLREESGVSVRTCATGQHREMLDQTLAAFGLRPDYDLNVMRRDQSLDGITAEILTKLGPILDEASPDWVLVQGDTTTTMASALAAFHRRVKVGHVEAGLRTGDNTAPFPEEANRRIVGVLADLHFAPTDESRRNLLREGVPSEAIVVTGNTGIDALRWMADTPPPDSVRRLLDGRRLVLVTAHRRESFGAPLERICLALRDLAERDPDGLCIVYPVHRNPRVEEPARRVLGSVTNIHLTPPLDYPTLVHLMKAAAVVLTDSGGIQEEAPHLGVPVLVLREVTERPEGLRAGAAKVIGTNREAIVREAAELLDDPAARSAMVVSVSPYGDGYAAGRIVRALIDH